MSFLSGLGKLVRPLAKGVSAVSHIPVLGGVLKALPVVGSGLALASTAADLYGMATGGGGGGSSGGLPMLPPPGTNSPGILPRGPGGSLQMPWSDPSPNAQAKPYALDDRYLKQIFRSPRGYVTMWDGGRHGVGKPFPILKSQAKHMRYADGSPVYRHHAKPPISVGEYHSLKKAHRTIKKVRKIHGLIHEVATHVTPHGKVLVHTHKKGHKK